MDSLFFASQNKTRILTETFALRQRMKAHDSIELGQKPALAT
jgi:hypothetical protein